MIMLMINLENGKSFTWGRLGYICVSGLKNGVISTFHRTQIVPQLQNVSATLGTSTVVVKQQEGILEGIMESRCKTASSRPQAGSGKCWMLGLALQLVRWWAGGLGCVTVFLIWPLKPTLTAKIQSKLLILACRLSLCDMYLPLCTGLWWGDRTRQDSRMGHDTSQVWLSSQRHRWRRPSFH